MRRGKEKGGLSAALLRTAAFSDEGELTACRYFPVQVRMTSAEARVPSAKIAVP